MNEITTPTPEQLDKLSHDAKDDWDAASKSLTNANLETLSAELIENKAMLLQTQQRLMAVAYFCFKKGDITSAQQFKQAGFNISVMKAAYCKKGRT